MTGQIPKYGKNFRRESTRYHPELANRVYALKRDSEWFIRSDKTSEKWRVYHGAQRDTATAFGTPLPTFSEAMYRLLNGIALGYYQVAAPGSKPAPPEVTSATYFSVDNQPVTVGAKFWSNDLRVVQVTVLAKRQNMYADTGCVQTWHETTEGDGGRGGSFDTLTGSMQPYGRLVRRFKGRDAEDYAPGTRYGDIKGARR